MLINKAIVVIKKNIDIIFFVFRRLWINIINEIINVIIFIKKIGFNNIIKPLIFPKKYIKIKQKIIMGMDLIFNLISFFLSSIHKPFIQIKRVKIGT